MDTRGCVDGAERTRVSNVMKCRNFCVWIADARGSGTVIAVGIIGAILGLTAGLLAALVLVTTHTRASVAADAAALAAANTASGRVAGDPCRAAEEAAAMHNAMLITCESSLRESTVRVVITAGAVRAEATARAGQPKLVVDKE